VRLLQDLALIPEFKELWRDLLSKPESFGVPSFTDLRVLYSTRTPTRFIASRVTPEMEQQLRFMLTHVRWASSGATRPGSRPKYLSSLESESLVSDLIRFICCAIHPTNQILQSNVVRGGPSSVGFSSAAARRQWNPTRASPSSSSWLFLSPSSDNIMNIEPAISLYLLLAPKYADLSNSLLDFLFLLLDHYDEDRRDVILQGLRNSVDILVGKGVIPNLHLLSESPHIPSHIRHRVLDLFPAYCRAEAFCAQGGGQWQWVVQVSGGGQGACSGARRRGAWGAGEGQMAWEWRRVPSGAG